MDSDKLETKLVLIGHLIKAAQIAEQLHLQVEGGNGRMFADTLRQVARQLISKPIYSNSCCKHGNSCVYLGDFQLTGGTLYDLYWCAWSRLPIARYGDSIFDYTSGYGHTLPAMVEAERRIKVAELK